MKIVSENSECRIEEGMEVKTTSAVMMIKKNLVIRFFFFQAEDGIRDLVRSRGLVSVYKRQA